MGRTIFSEKFDYLLITFTLALSMWAFYGTKAAIGSAVIVAAVANLQPVRQLGISTNAAAFLAASLLLILSICLKIVDQSGYCYAQFGPQRQMVDLINLQMPCFADNDFYSDLGQPGGMGYVRDIGLSLIGLVLGLSVLRNISKEG